MSAAAAPESPSDAASEAASAAATEAACEEKLKCKGCGSKPRSMFTVNLQTKKPYSVCEPCKPIVAARSNLYKKTEKGKARAKRFNASEKGKACEKRRNASEKGKERRRRETAKNAERRTADPTWRLMKNTHELARKVLTGKTENSPKFLTADRREREPEPADACSKRPRPRASSSD